VIFLWNDFDLFDLIIDFLPLNNYLKNDWELFLLYIMIIGYPFAFPVLEDTLVNKNYLTIKMCD
jgi:hypothetical protein